MVNKKNKRPKGHRTSGTTQLNIALPEEMKTALEERAATYGRGLKLECLIAFDRHLKSEPVAEVPSHLMPKRRGRPASKK
jgi:hypothetical protein